MTTGEAIAEIDDQIRRLHRLRDRLVVLHYVAGSPVNSAAFNPPTIGSAPLGIGSDPASGGGCYIGNIDDVRIYNRVLTAAEILAIKNGAL